MRLYADATKCVVFFGVKKSQPDTEDEIIFGGTGTLVADTYDGPVMGFLVTAKHVAVELERHDEFYVRINTIDGRSRTLESQPGYRWIYFDDDPTVDLAVLPFHCIDTVFDVTYFDLSETIKTHKVMPIRCGDIISIVGLFRLHHGSLRNVPIVHTGNLAVLADPNELVNIVDRGTGKSILIEAHLVEAHTLQGLSGGPVFIHDVIGLNVQSPFRGQMPMAHGSVTLLGIYIGSWKDHGEANRSIGMGLVVPFSKLLYLIREHPRTLEIRERKKKGLPAFDLS